MLVAPSPKRHEKIPPDPAVTLDWFVNCTVRGDSPIVGLAENEATGVGSGAGFSALAAGVPPPPPEHEKTLRERMIEME